MAPTAPDAEPAFPPFTDAVEGAEGCLATYPLRGDRVLLRPVDARHLAQIAPLAAASGVPRLSDPATLVAESHAQAERGLALTLAVERQGDGALLGLLSLERDRGDPSRAEVGYWLGQPHRGQGLATEAVRIALAHAVDDLGFTAFTATAAPDNPHSRRVLEKVGFTGAGETLTLTAEGFQAARARPVLLVSAVALIDTDNRVLLQKRPPGKALAGLWEFPGGKVDPGESPERALIRELHEELGIDVRESCLAPLTFASHAYPTFHLLMPLYLCRQWKGTPAAREGQDLAWAAPNRLNTYPMPPADIPLIPILRDWLT